MNVVLNVLPTHLPRYTKFTFLLAESRLCSSTVSALVNITNVVCLSYATTVAPTKKSSSHILLTLFLDWSTLIWSTFNWQWMAQGPVFVLQSFNHDFEFVVGLCPGDQHVGPYLGYKVQVREHCVETHCKLRNVMPQDDMASWLGASRVGCLLC